MALREKVSVQRIENEADRDRAIEVLAATYRVEKRWVDDESAQLPLEEIGREDISWFLVTVADKPVGVLRVLYDPPLSLYETYGFEMLEDAAELDLEQFINEHQIAEIGRFAVLPEYRKYMMVVAGLMRAAATETVARGYTHYITDVFEDDPHSPLKFHTRVMGFQPIATHAVGELHCDSRRITLILDIKESYTRLKDKGNWIFRFLTEGWDEALHRRLA